MLACEYAQSSSLYLMYTYYLHSLYQIHNQKLHFKSAWEYQFYRT
jgi:hypothetical protein